MSEQAVAYAALILADAEVEITADKLLALTKAAGVSDVEPIWAQLFAKAIAKQNITELLTSFAAGGAASAGPAAVGGAAAAAGEAEEAPVEEEEASKEESDDDMGFGLFD